MKKPKKTKTKYILGLSLGLLLGISFYANTNIKSFVIAKGEPAGKNDKPAPVETPKVKEYGKCDTAVIAARYKLTLEKDLNVNNKFTVTLGDSEKLSATNGAEFRILVDHPDTIGEFSPAEKERLRNLRLTNKTPLSFFITPKDNLVDTHIVGQYRNEVRVYFELVKSAKNVPEEEKICLGVEDGASYKDRNRLELSVGYLNEGNPIRDEIALDASEENINVGEGKICTNFINGVYDKKQFDTPNVHIRKADFDRFNYNAVSAENKETYESVLSYCFKDKVIIGTNYTEDEIGQMIGAAITAVKSENITTDDTEFNKIFDDLKSKVPEKNKVSAKDANDKVYENKCDPFSKKREPGYYPDENVNYYYSSESSSESIQYSYHLSPSITVTDENPITICTKTCEEVVKVEYGAPVATMAGMCFEYKVKVTSYVRCNSTLNNDAKPNTGRKVCTPAPRCHASSITYTQAGPKEDFESCIKRCDGGKYSEKCSLKCYKEVYGKNINYKTPKLRQVNNAEDITNSYGNAVIDKCIKENGDGCYDWKNNEILWYQRKDVEIDDKIRAGRWYRLLPNYDLQIGTGPGQGYRIDNQGFKRANASNEYGECTETCDWGKKVGENLYTENACKKDEYLNPASKAQDDKANLFAYKNAVNKCKAEATCSKTTSNYTIAVNYDSKSEDGKVTTNKIYFPFTDQSQHDKNYHPGIKDEYKGRPKVEFVNGLGMKDDFGVIKDYAGCHDDYKEGNHYMTEWTFPGVYQHNKGGQMSYKIPDNPKAWSFYKENFCLPVNAQSVNPLWWEWKVIDNKCVLPDEILRKEFGENAKPSNGYNIEAKTEDFGYFNWNFDIKCFYGIKVEKCIPNEDKCCTPTPDQDEEDETPSPGTPTPDENKGSGYDYYIRTVDRKNMFPNTKPGTDKEFKRGIGFNWTQNALLPKVKNPAYYVNPEELITKIEEDADLLYGEEPDYSFYLTPEDLNAIRRYNKHNNYTEWLGDVVEINGVNVYESNLFRPNVGDGQGYLLDGDAVKKVGQPGLNNE